MSLNSEQFDVVVIGGGPGGSTAASLIAMQGHRVLLLEKDEFPRHQIGESLLPSTVHGICKILGLTEELAAAEFTKKRGGTFRWGKRSEPWTFAFAKNPDAPRSFAYQVERRKFDKMLLDNAVAKGVQVKQRCQVKEILFNGDRAVGVRYLNREGGEVVVHCRYIVDAGGNQSQSYNPHVGTRVYSELFKNVALYGYFEGGKRLPPPNEGNILSCAFKDGWFWYIPLSENLTSVGAVVSRDRASGFSADYEGSLNGFIEQCPLVKQYLANGKRITHGEYGKIRVRTDYSYCNTKFWRPGLALIGDAACFVDPVFSSGVHLATYSALLVARSINTCLRNASEPETLHFQEFELRYRREYGHFYQFCSAFYDMEQSEESYFWAACKVLNSSEAHKDAFVRLVAGAGGRDPVFSPEVMAEARTGLGEWFENTTEEMSGNFANEDDAEPKFDKKKFDPTKFMQGFTSEIVQVQLQALYGKDRPKDRPMYHRGLIPSKDGLHWVHV